jgi:hypothetical protein
LALIEFFSVPGAGKTTLANALALECGWLTRSQLSDLWQRRSTAAKARSIATSLAAPSCTSAGLVFLRQLGLKSPEGVFRLGRLLAKREWIRSRQSQGHIILDQGFLQDLWSILYCTGQREVTDEPVSRLIACLYDGMDVQVVFLDLDLACAVQRISGRKSGDSRLDKLPADEVERRLRDHAWIMTLIRRSAAMAGLESLQADGTKSAAELVRQLRLDLGCADEPHAAPRR